jgi:hypothetical protein
MEKQGERWRGDAEAKKHSHQAVALLAACCAGPPLPLPQPSGAALRPPLHQRSNLESKLFNNAARLTFCTGKVGSAIEET